MNWFSCRFCCSFVRRLVHISFVWKSSVAVHFRRCAIEFQRRQVGVKLKSSWDTSSEWRNRASKWVSSLQSIQIGRNGSQLFSHLSRKCARWTENIKWNCLTKWCVLKQQIYQIHLLCTDSRLEHLSRLRHNQANWLASLKSHTARVNPCNRPMNNSLLLEFWCKKTRKKFLLMGDSLWTDVLGSWNRMNKAHVIGIFLGLWNRSASELMKQEFFWVEIGFRRNSAGMSSEIVIKYRKWHQIASNANYVLYTLHCFALTLNVSTITSRSMHQPLKCQTKHALNHYWLQQIDTWYSTLRSGNYFIELNLLSETSKSIQIHHVFSVFFCFQNKFPLLFLQNKFFRGVFEESKQVSSSSKQVSSSLKTNFFFKANFSFLKTNFFFFKANFSFLKTNVFFFFFENQNSSSIPIKLYLVQSINQHSSQITNMICYSLHKILRIKRDLFFVLFYFHFFHKTPHKIRTPKKAN